MANQQVFRSFLEAYLTDNFFSATFSEDNGAAAREFLREQSSRWVELTDIIMQTARNDQRLQRYHPSIQQLRDFLKTKVPSTIQTQSSGGGLTYQATIPLLDQISEPVKSFIKSEFWTAVAGIISSAYNPVVRTEDGMIGQSDGLFSDPRFQAAMIEYNALTRPEFKSVNLLLAEATLQSEELGRTGERVAAEDKQRRDIFAGMQSKQMDTLQAAETQFHDMMLQGRAEIKAATSVVREDAVFKNAQLLWSNKFSDHIRRVWFGFGTMVAVFAAIGYEAYWHGGQIIEKLPTNKTTGDVTYIAILLVVIPFIALAWPMRIIGKWITDNMAFATDAEQRKVMLATYLSLVGSAEAKMEPTDRVLILNAIFRPLPGFQSEDVAPASLMDLAKDAVMKKG